MITYLRFRFQRVARRYGRIFSRAWQGGLHYIQYDIFGKWRQLAMIRRFAFGWWFIIVAMAAGLFFQVRGVSGPTMVLQAQPGGIYREAVVGTVKNLNPILPEGGVASDATHLIFSGLTRFNTNGQIEPDIATGWSVSPDGKTYTFHLRRNVKWHDGVPFTAQDVVFTLTAIQNPDTRSPLAASWRGVHAEAKDDYTVVFTLPKPYAPFINATNVGMLPRHLLENTDPSALRVAEFNQKPVGTGPYMIEQFEPDAGEISFKANRNYYLGKPLMDGVVLRLYPDYDKAFEAYSHRQVQGVSRLQSGSNGHESGTLKLYEASVPDQVVAFFKTTSPILQDKSVRNALAQATDRQGIIRAKLQDQATPLTIPLLSSRLGLAGTPHQPAYSKQKAEAALDTAGWKKGSDGIRVKGGQKLELALVTQKNTPYGGVAEVLAKQWLEVGAKLNVKEVDGATLQQSYIRSRHYDVLLYGINVGADPDVYAFWDSSQKTDPGLNLSVYQSKAADQALEGGRTVGNPALRTIKYRSFVQTWVADAPAVMLYTPTYTYGVDNSVHGIHLRKLINPSDRFTGIERWSLKVKAVSPH